MKTKSLSFMGVLLSTVLLSLMFLVSITTSEFPPDPQGEYSPWVDLNDNGEIDIFDLVWMAGRYGALGTPVNKTELLYNVSDTFNMLLDKIDALNSTVIEQQIIINNLKANLTRPLFFFSDGSEFFLEKDKTEGTTGWVTAKTITISPETLKNGTVIVEFNHLSGYRDTRIFTCFCRIVVSGTEKAYWSWAPPPEPELYFYSAYVARALRHEALMVDGLDNSVDVTINLEFKIDAGPGGDLPTVLGRMYCVEFKVIGW